MSQRYVVIGASAAGIGVLSKLRALDPHGEIICVAAQAEMPNNTCLIADLLAGHKTEAEVYTKDAAFFAENRIDLRLSTRVESIDSDAQIVFLSDERVVQPSTETGELEEQSGTLGKYALEYDKLFLGTGTTAIIPPTFSRDQKGLFTFHTFADVVAINSFIATHKVQRAVVVGAGLSGIECADALAARGIVVDVVEMQSHILHRFIDAQGSATIEGWMRKHHVNFHPSSTVKYLKTNGDSLVGVQLNNDSSIDCQMLIFAIGGRPDLTLAEAANLTLSDGAIHANEFMKSSDPNIYVGGDIARIKDLATGKWLRSCNWPDAVMQGMNAAHGMAGVEKPYPGTAIIVGSKFFGSGFVTCGFVQNSKYTAQKRIDETGYRCFLYEENVLKAFCMVGNVDHVGQLRKYIVSRQFLTEDEQAALLK